ncbi:MAG: hypothetical protein GPI95_05845 [Microcystis aeruginosa LG13-11]|nr:hypothetical protein [Microcystis aeruginosa LG13-11]
MSLNRVCGKKFFLVAGCGVWGVGCGGSGNYELGRWGSGEIELKPQNPKTPKPQNLSPISYLLSPVSYLLSPVSYLL